MAGDQADRAPGSRTTLYLVLGLGVVLVVIAATVLLFSGRPVQNAACATSSGLGAPAPTPSGAISACLTPQH